MRKNANPKLPKGYRKLKRGEVIQDGDFQYDPRPPWTRIVHSIGSKYSKRYYGIVIRYA